MLVKLYKLAYEMDRNGLHSEADKIQEVMIDLAKRVGFSADDMISLADYLDKEGDVELANYFDDMSKSAKKKRQATKKMVG